MPVVQKLALAAKAGLGADGVSVLQFNEAAGGQVVFHLHFHVIPRFDGVSLKPPGGPMAAAAELEPDRRQNSRCFGEPVSDCIKFRRGVPNSHAAPFC